MTRVISMRTEDEIEERRHEEMPTGGLSVFIAS